MVEFGRSMPVPWFHMVLRWQSRSQLSFPYGVVAIVSSSASKFNRRASSKGVEFAAFAVVLVPVVETGVRL